MKELSIEEKAKAYDEALARANEMIKSMTNIGGVAKVDDIQHIFPELKESEDDRMVKFIKNQLFNIKKTITENYELDAKLTKAICWLEKQCEQKIKTPEESLGIDSDTYNKIVDECIYGEQKPIDKVEPNFKVGDWVVYCNDNVDLITGIEENGYCVNNSSYIPFICESDIRLWTVQDAKDGDVLASEDKDKVFIYNGKLDLRGRVCAYCGIYKTYDGLRFTKCAIGNYFTYKEPHPATKEQRDLLFTKMKEAGYEWNVEKKELKKIEQKFTPKYKNGDCIEYRGGKYKITKVTVTPHNFFYDVSLIEVHSDLEEVVISIGMAAEEQMSKIEQKPAWSEEDEKQARQIKRIAHDGCTQKLQKQIADWLESLKERYTWKQSDEQMNNK